MWKRMCEIVLSAVIAGVLYAGCLDPAAAQNVTCATRPTGDSTNACASTAFVQNTTSPLYITCSASQWVNSITAVGSTCLQPAASDLSNGTTGTGTVVLASASTITYDTIAAATAATIPNTPTIYVRGALASGDVGGIQWVRSASVPSHTAYFQSADGAYWSPSLANAQFPIEVFGGKCDSGVTNNSLAWNKYVSFINVVGTVKLTFSQCNYYGFSTVPTSITVNAAWMEGVSATTPFGTNLGMNVNGDFFTFSGVGSNIIKNMQICTISGKTTGDLLKFVATAAQGSSENRLDNITVGDCSGTHTNSINLDGSAKVTGAVGNRDNFFSNIFTKKFNLNCVVGFSLFGGVVLNGANSSFDITGSATCNPTYIKIDVEASSGVNFVYAQDAVVRANTFAGNITFDVNSNYAYVIGRTNTVTVTNNCGTPANCGAATELGSGTNTFTSLFVNNNAVSLPTPPAGTLVQVGNADGSTTVETLDAFAVNSSLSMRRANTTAAAPSALTTNDKIGSIDWLGRGSTAYGTSRASIEGYASGVWTDASQDTYIVFKTTPSASVTPIQRMGITSAGVIKLGVTGSNSGVMEVDGSTSGAITLQPQAAAGTYNWNWPITAGSSGQSLLSGGGGGSAMSWGDRVSSVICNGGVTTITTTGTCASRELLSATRTYYVRTDGNNACNGMTNAAGASGNCAFLTLQKAIDVTYGTLDLGGQNVNITLVNTSSPSTFTTGGVISAPQTGAGTITIKGSTGVAADVVISTTSADVLKVSNHGSAVTIQDLKITSATSGYGLYASTGGAITFSNINFGATANAQIRSDDSGIVTATGSIGYTISGGSTHHMQAINGVIRNESKTITLSGTPAFSTAFAQGNILGGMIIDNITWSGSATGTRWLSAYNAVIYANTTCDTYIPGNAAGTASVGGVCQ